MADFDIAEFRQLFQQPSALTKKENHQFTEIQN
jgi:hypothetical protein